ncbi:dihydrodipicolinate synthase [Lineolata rhizophorae]|uniref:Dihydrodipicolinate synthase n=1 Tax=Lineolata rhizophorae TaxID=578093 RepID=A0A6A6NX88_9PEZI|nr:dihydrodipicolinate synthase [Lineolata rhizophorae]
MAMTDGAVHLAPPPPGAWVPVPTFFSKSTPSSTQAPVDLATQIKHSVHLAKSGITGLVLLGSTGEAVHLSREERKDLVAGVRSGMADAGYPDYPIMAGILTNSVDDVLENLKDMHEAGADWGLVLAPGYFGAVVDQANIIEWYTQIADASPIGILIYNYPGVTNNLWIAPETYFKLAGHPKILGCKMSHGNMSHHIQVALAPQIDHSLFRLYSGFGQQAFPVVSCGGAGVIDGLASVYPAVVSTLHRLATAPSIGPEALLRIQKLQWLVSRGYETMGKYGIVGFKEGICRELKLGTMEGGRLPLKGKMPEGEWEKWSDVFDALREEEKRCLSGV